MHLPRRCMQACLEASRPRLGLTWEATISPMPVSICLGETAWVEEPSPPRTLDVPTRAMPACAAAAVTVP